MKRNLFLKILGFSGIIMTGLTLMSSDHMDAPSVTEEPTDVTDFYAFTGNKSDNLVFAITSQGMMSPETTKTTSFSENVLMEINIDNNEDNIEDLVIQAIPKGNKMYFFGPVKPSETGTVSVVEKKGIISKVKISTIRSTKISKNRLGMKFFAGPRDDPFFFDAGQFIAIASGQATSFNNPGTDTFAGTNALGIVIEVPKKLLGSKDTLNVWVETKILQ
ncbi:DUF4331 family protein [uncultured Aquimarina sp.]|uniref:DUF4331 family protein n=1 Tax=uncultured Aquimarina sp. TaxID=575652 RepID=UPI0026357788|nr:DUF4331 family protein [uncultured Aquimarina sp.]